MAKEIEAQKLLRLAELPYRLPTTQMPFRDRWPVMKDYFQPLLRLEKFRKGGEYQPVMLDLQWDMTPEMRDDHYGMLNEDL